MKEDLVLEGMVERWVRNEKEKYGRNTESVVKY